MAPRNYQGTKDYRGSEVLKRQWAAERIEGVFKLFGFEPLETPAIELQETLLGKTGGETGAQIFRWRQGGFQTGEDLGLRFDHTVPLARVIAQYAGEMKPNLPYKRYAIGPVFRAEKPQAGRFRQFTQLDIDTVGTPSMLADAEVIALCVYTLKELGLSDFVVEVNNRKILNGLARSLGLSGEDAISLMRGWDKLGKKKLEEIEQEYAETLGKEKAKEAIRLTKKLTEAAGNSKEALLQVLAIAEETREGVGETQLIFDTLKNMGIAEEYVAFNPLLARGLDYYTGPVFELTVKQGGVGSIGGGGRYDKLIEALGGPDIPATGVSFGLERVTSVLDQLGILPSLATTTGVFVTVFNPRDPQSLAYSSRIVGVLREAGINTEMYVGEEKIGSQLAVANRKLIPYAIIAGPDEEKRSVVTVKDLTIPLEKGKGGKDKRATQVEVPFDLLANHIKGKLPSR